MSLFNKPRSEPTQQEYENYMAGYRLGHPVDDDEPTTLTIDPNNPEFRRGLVEGVNNWQANQECLRTHPIQPTND